MSGIIAFIKSKSFFVNLGLIVLSSTLIFFITIKSLAAYTNHGEYVEVPDFKNKLIAELPSFTIDKNVNFQIIDSIYDPKEKPGIVIRQDPEYKSKVKHNRTIYLYVTGMVPPKISMPKLVDRSERQAKMILSSYGLKIGKITEKSADCNGCVLAQLFDGKEINPGELVKKGSLINLVIGRKDYYYTGTNSDSTQTQDTPPNFNNDDDGI
jgi:beta-lactam-binding protein with PASTA domain